MREQENISFLHKLTAEDYDRFGGKAANLAKLHQAGFRTPQGFSIACDCFSQYLADIPDATNLIEQIEAADDIEDILSLSLELEVLGETYRLPEDLEAEISNAYSELNEIVGVTDAGFSVRSSANVEDGKRISFAGQAESFLCVVGIDELLESVKKTWRSLLTTNSVLYLQSMGIPLSQVQMGVVIQEMINADISGVMFTANVVNNDRTQMIVESVWGLGETLVAGKATPDTYLLEKDSLVVKERSLGTKEVYASPAESGGTILNPTPPEKRALFTLTNDDVIRLAGTGLEIERKMGLYQDIEWCIQEHEIMILQSRPITTLR